MVLFTLVAGFLPFEDPNTSALYKKILSGSYEKPNWLSHGGFKSRLETIGFVGEHNFGPCRAARLKVAGAGVSIHIIFPPARATW